MRRALRDLRNMHGGWVRSGRRGARRFPIRSFGCLNRDARLSTDSVSSSEATGETRFDAFIPAALSRLFFCLIPVRRVALQRIHMERTPVWRTR